MSWEHVLQTFTASLATLGGWFLFQLVTEFKTFKKEAGRDIIDLKLERQAFQTTVRAAELTIGMRVNDMQKLHNEFTLDVNKSLMLLGSDMDRIRIVTNSTMTKAENFESFLKKSLQVSQALSQKLDQQKQELQSLKIQVGEVLILKTKKSPS